MQLDDPSDLREATLEILAQVVHDPLIELAQLRLDAQADSPRSVTATS
jgi:hypothetical protein